LIFYSCSLISRGSGSAISLLPESAQGSQDFSRILLDFSAKRRMAWMKRAGNNEAQNDPAGAGSSLDFLSTFDP
jgi:hypothetical protein